ncbi:MAG: hypothetical protein KDC00_13025 [Flavobacteriales bacterium]|nr:hypothetical protein [Flavobacteriales bacterium]
MSGILLALSYTALLLWLMRKLPYFRAVPGLPLKWVSAIFLLKILAGTALWAVYTYVYSDRATADVFKYFDDSAHMYKALHDRPLDYLRMLLGIGNDTPEFMDRYYSYMNNWVRHFESNLYNDAHTIIRYNAAVRLVSFGEFHVHTVLSAFLSLAGMLGIHRAFVRVLPGLERVLAAVVFLLPSVLFWTSGVIKECLLFFGLGLLIYVLDRMAHERPRWYDLPVLAFVLVLLFFLKFYVLMSLLPALVLLYWARHAPRPKLGPKMLVTYGVFILLGLNLHHIVPGLDVLGILTMKQRDFVGLALKMDSGSFVMPELLLPDPLLFLRRSPNALFITLLGPLVHAGPGALGLMSMLENLGILLFLGFCLYFKRPWAQVDHALMVALLGYVIVLALVIGWTTPVMGAVVRYRTPLLPFLLIIGLLLLDREKLLRRAPRLDPFITA